MFKKESKNFVDQARLDYIIGEVEDLMDKYDLSLNEQFFLLNSLTQRTNLKINKNNAELMSSGLAGKMLKKYLGGDKDV